MVKITITLDNKDDYDLLMTAAQERLDRLRLEYRDTPTGPKRAQVHVQHSQAEALIKKLAQ